MNVLLKSVLSAVFLIVRQPKVLGVLLVLAVGASAYFYTQYQATQSEVKRFKENPQAAAQGEVKDLVEKVGRIVVLPEKELPTVATVTDAKKLKDQPFFAKAQNGDKVLIFTQAKKAILYRPSTNKIIEVAPVNIGAASRIALYNGTDSVGLTNTVEKQLEDKINNVDVVIKENASKDYDKTIVVDLSGTRRALADQIAKELNGEVGSLPSEEKRPNADILVILGK